MQFKLRTNWPAAETISTGGISSCSSWPAATFEVRRDPELRTLSRTVRLWSYRRLHGIAYHAWAKTNEILDEHDVVARASRERERPSKLRIRLTAPNAPTATLSIMRVWRLYTQSCQSLRRPHYSDLVPMYIHIYSDLFNIYNIYILSNIILNESKLWGLSVIMYYAGLLQNYCMSV